jgi:hypothetical protein
MTHDPDYSPHDGGAHQRSGSVAEATMGSSHGGGACLTLGGFSDDGTGEKGDGDENARNRTELIDIYAPAGKLGVVIETADNGAPYVHGIKECSVIRDKLQEGDILVAVDDEDVRTMKATTISRLLGRKSGNNVRKLTFVRTVGQQGV